MNLSRRNFIKIAGLSAAAVAGAALFTGCSGQLMLPVRSSATVIGKDIQKALDTKQFSVVASLKPDAQSNASSKTSSPTGVAMALLNTTARS